MKKYLFTPIVFFHLAIFAQNSEVFKIDSLPKQGVLLDKGWRCKVGDNSEWAKYNYDDRDWISFTVNCNS